MKKSNVLASIAGLVFLLIIPLMFLYENQDNVVVEEVDCFDEYNNKMIGLVCEDEVKQQTWMANAAVACVLSAVFILILALRQQCRED